MNTEIILALWSTFSCSYALIATVIGSRSGGYDGGMKSHFIFWL